MKIETKYDLGQKFYFVSEVLVRNVRRKGLRELPDCSFCNNTRKVQINGANEEIETVNCPKCTKRKRNKQTEPVTDIWVIPVVIVDVSVEASNYTTRTDEPEVDVSYTVFSEGDQDSYPYFSRTCDEGTLEARTIPDELCNKGREEDLHRYIQQHFDRFKLRSRLQDERLNVKLTLREAIDEPARQSDPSSSTATRENPTP